MWMIWVINIEGTTLRATPCTVWPHRFNPASVLKGTLAPKASPPPLLAHFGFLVCMCVCVCPSSFHCFIVAYVTPISVCFSLILAPFWFALCVCALDLSLHLLLHFSCLLSCGYVCLYVWRRTPLTPSVSPTLLCNKSSCGCREASSDSIAVQDLRLLSSVCWRRRAAQLLQQRQV